MSKQKGYKTPHNFLNTTQTGDITDITWGQAYDINYYILCELYRNAFKLMGLPINIRENYVYDILGHYGSIAFVNDKTYGLNAFSYTTIGQCNEYDYPVNIKVNVMGKNRNYWAGKVLNFKDFVIMRNNGKEKPIYPMLSFYAKQLASSALECDNILKSLKVLCMIITDKTQSFDSENIANAFNRNAQFFEYATKENENSLPGQDVKSPIIPVSARTQSGVLREAQEYVNQLKNDVWQLLGLGSLQMQKKAQMNESELALTDKINMLNSYSIIDERQKACVEIGKKWGYKIISCSHLGLNEICGSNAVTDGGEF